MSTDEQKKCGAQGCGTGSSGEPLPEGCWPNAHEGPGKDPEEAWPPPQTSIAARLGLVKFNPDENPHLTVLDPEVCRQRCLPKYCTHSCPAQVYRWDGEEKLITIAYEGCLECGTCRSGGCPFRNIEMRYPRGGFGVQYRFG